MVSRKMVTDEPICRAAIDTDTENRLWTQWGKERMGQIERLALKHTPYHMQNK